MPDVEATADPTSHKPRGYPKIASFMSSDVDVAIFHRFRDLTLLSLLSLQAEIIQLQKQFRRTCIADDICGDEHEQLFSRSFSLSMEQNSEQHRQLQAIRLKLREYCKHV